MHARMKVLAVLLALVASACGSSEDAVTTAAPTTTAASTAAPTTTAATSTVAPTTTAPDSFDAEDAKDVASAYFEAYNDHDLDAVYTLLTPDIEFSGSFFGSMSRPAWEQLLVWNAAQGTVLGIPNCLVAEELVDVSTRLVCSYGHSDAAIQAVDAQAVPMRLTLVITPDGIADWSRDIDGPPSFIEVGRPFDRWMRIHHPDVAEDVEFDNWNSVEGAEQNGILTAEYAALWRVYLDEEGCRYDERC